jgi:hypothetical protein
MTQSSSAAPNLRWRLGLIAAGVVVVITSIPQIGLMVKRGGEWQGSYALIDFDELSYAAYLNSLIDGRLRRNNPYLGRESDRRNLGESYFSIQSLPAYAVALPARALGLSTSTTLIVIARVMAFASALAVFWLLFQITKNEKVSAVGTLIVLLCGRFASENPLMAVQYYSSFAFLRLYLPAVPFPLFFLFCGFVWRAFVDQSKRWAVAAGAVLAVLIFSYFYLWTAAAAWLFCFGLLWLVARAADRRAVVKGLLIVAAVSIAALVPYVYLLSQRAHTIDEDQALTFSRAPDLFRVTEIISLLVVLILIVHIRRRHADWGSPQTLFVIACANTPFVVFNQQVITGISLQAFHYEQFIINYVVLVSVIGTYQLVWSHFKIRPIMWAAFAIGVGLVTALKDVHDNSALNVRRDQARPIFKQLEASDRYGWVLFDNSLLAASALTDSSMPQLWSPNMHIYGGIDTAEKLDRYYQYLYLLGVEPQTFAYDLQNNPQTRKEVFGLQRVNGGLTQEFVSISDAEVRGQVESYTSYVNNFSEQQANRWPLVYVITIADHDFTNLDRWYQKTAIKHVGECVVYELRTPPVTAPTSAK